MFNAAAKICQIECCIDEWTTGVREDIKFSSVAYSPVYLGHLDSLLRFRERTAAYKLLGKISDNLLDVAQFHAGVSMAVIIDGFADDVFDDAIREYKAKTRVVRGEGHEGVEMGDA
ncbi:hypothetical protein BDR07DRAFT_1493008 [Suillus spraguei]|nr:hypothetical protein BDR07DRAFT_1493008 [Suillus spraguei]